MRSILFFTLFLFCLNSYPASPAPSTIQAGKIHQTTYILEDITPYAFMNMVKQIGVSSGLRLTSSVLFTLSQLYHSRNNPLKAKIATYTGYSLLQLWYFGILYGWTMDIYPHIYNQLGALSCGKRQGSMPFFIKNQWLADRVHFVFKSSPENTPVLWITPIDHPKATESHNEIPGWQNLLDILKQRGIQHLGVSIASAPEKSPDGRLPMELQVYTHYHSGRQSAQGYPIEGADKAVVWDLELMSWHCLPHTHEKIYSLFDSRTIQQLAGLLGSDTPVTLKPKTIEVTASGRGYLLAQVKTGQQEHFKLGYSAYGHYVTLEPSGRSVSELERLLSGPQSRLLMAYDSKQQVVEWARPLAISLQTAANYGAGKAGQLLVRQADSFLFQDKGITASEPFTTLKKAKPVYFNKQWFLILSALMVSPAEVVPEATEIDSIELNGYQESLEAGSAPIPLTSVGNVAVQSNRLVIEPEDSWAQSVFYAISSLRWMPETYLPGSSVLYGSQGFAVGMQIIYGRFSSQIIPDDWDFMVEKYSLAQLLMKLGVPEEIKDNFLTHQNKKSDLFEYTKEWDDGRKLSLEVLAYNIHARDPKGIRITLYQPEEGEQHHKTYQFDLLLVEALPDYDNIFVAASPDSSSFYCNLVTPTYYLDNWEDMWNRLDRKALEKALPRINYWLQEEYLYNRFPDTDVLQRLTTLSNNIQMLLSSSNQEAVISSGEVADAQPDSSMRYEDLPNIPSGQIKSDGYVTCSPS